MHLAFAAAGHLHSAMPLQVLLLCNLCSLLQLTSVSTCPIALLVQHRGLLEVGVSGSTSACLLPAPLPPKYTAVGQGSHLQHPVLLCGVSTSLCAASQLLRELRQ